MLSIIHHPIRKWNNKTIEKSNFLLYRFRSGLYRRFFSKCTNIIGTNLIMQSYAFPIHKEDTKNTEHKGFKKYFQLGYIRSTPLRIQYPLHWVLMYIEHRKMYYYTWFRIQKRVAQIGYLFIFPYSLFFSLVFQQHI